MESYPKLAAEYEKNMADIPTACKWGKSMIHAMTGNTVYEFRFYIDENSNMSAGSISGPSEKREMFERSRQKAKQGKTRRTEKDILYMHEVKITGNDVQSLTERLVAANAPSKNVTVSGTTGVDIKI